MSGQSAIVEAATETSIEPGIQAGAGASARTEPGIQAGASASASAPPPPTADPAAEPEVTIQDVLVEDVSIDGMCGVY